VPVGTSLVLDDLQWAEFDALDLLAVLTRSAAEVPLRVVGAYRDTEVEPPAPLAVRLPVLVHTGLVTRRVLIYQLAPVVRHHPLRCQQTQ